MNNKKLKAFLIASGAIAMVFGIHVSAEEPALTPGVTVNADEESATGYTATFVYEDGDAQSVSLVGGMAFFYDDGSVGKNPEISYTPYEWKPDMIPSGDGGFTTEMTKVDGTDYWTAEVPLPSGKYLYAYNVNDAEQNISDPENIPLTADVENGNAFDRSVFYVPYDAEKQAGYKDWSFLMERTDEKKGSVSFVNYEDLDGTQRPLGIYLPYGYDEAGEDYNVLYLSHGGGGNETDWFYGGSADHIFDNLIADGEVEPTIVVTMNNSVYDWDYDRIITNLMDHIIPYMEKNYNVSPDTSGRAFAGLSMGGMTTSNVYYKCADQFDYFGIFSGAEATIDTSTLDLETLKQPFIMIGAGKFDMAYVNDSYQQEGDRTSLGLKENMDAAGIPYRFHEVDGAHDWFVWPQLLNIFAENYLWK